MIQQIDGQGRLLYVDYHNLHDGKPGLTLEEYDEHGGQRMPKMVENLDPYQIHFDRTKEAGMLKMIRDSMIVWLASNYHRTAKSG